MRTVPKFHIPCRRLQGVDTMLSLGEFMTCLLSPALESRLRHYSLWSLCYTAFHYGVAAVRASGPFPRLAVALNQYSVYRPGHAVHRLTLPQELQQ
jgi:hypothetical protein